VIPWPILSRTAAWYIKAMRRAMRILAWVLLLGGSVAMAGSWMRSVGWISPRGRADLTLSGGSVEWGVFDFRDSVGPGWRFEELSGEDRKDHLQWLGYTSPRFSRNNIHIAGFVYVRFSGPYALISFPLWPPLLATAGILYCDRRRRKRLGGTGFEVVGSSP
jgi:hypothetical protein